MDKYEPRVEPSVWKIADAINGFWALAKKRAAYMHREGFFRPVDAESSDLPLPLPREKAWKGEREFREKLIALEGRRHITRIEMSGRDACHFCDAKLVRTEYWVLGQWKWRVSLYHYVAEHHVRPSVGFQEFVVQRELK